MTVAKTCGNKNVIQDKMHFVAILLLMAHDASMRIIRTDSRYQLILVLIYCIYIRPSLGV